MYNVQIQDDAPGGIHADWSGMHAGAIYEALRSFHRSVRSRSSPDDAVRQVEWGAYECTLRGSQVRQLLEQAADPQRDWRAEPLEMLAVGHTRLVGQPGLEPPGSRTLGWLHEHVVEDHLYTLTAETFE